MCVRTVAGSQVGNPKKCGKRSRNAQDGRQVRMNPVKLHQKR